LSGDLEIHAIAHRPDGSAASFDLTVTPARRHSEHDYQCFIMCPLLGFDQPHPIYSAIEDETVGMALGFVHQLLIHLDITLSDDQGRPVDLCRLDWDALL
jgi:hypothetical protein